MAAYEAVLRVELRTPEELVKVVEILSNTMCGLALSGYSPAVASSTLCPGCEDCDNSEDSEDPEDPETAKEAE